MLCLYNYENMFKKMHGNFIKEMNKILMLAFRQKMASPNKTIFSVSIIYK